MIAFNMTHQQTPLETIRENYLVTSPSTEVTTPAVIKRQVVAVGCILSVGSILIISINLLVVIALVLLIRKRGYQSWCFVLNLSIADILVGVAITGIATDALKGTTASMEKGICLLRMTFIIAPSAASILTMFLISLDRYAAIKLPLRYSQLMNNKMIAGTLVPVWLIAVTLAFLPCIFEPMQKEDYHNVCTFFSVIEPKSIILLFCLFFFPLLSIFIYIYMDILKIACGHQKRIRAQLAGSRFLTSSRYWGHVKALRTVAMLVGCFTLCWCPFFVVSIVQASCPTCKLYDFLENHLWLLGLSNSLINPLVYACWQREVRNQICEIFAHIKVGLCRVTHSQTVDRCPADHPTVTQAVTCHDKILPTPLNFSSPLTKVKLINELNEKEAELDVKDSVSWHSVYKDSAWVFIGGLPYELTEGDVICVFSQYGEIANINLVRDKKTGKSKGFCFLCYEDQRSTVLAVDNFNGIKIKGRTIRVDHVANYRPPKDTDDIDDITKRLREEGCAPKVPPPSSSESESEEEYAVPVKKTKKDKKEKKKKKKEKKEKKKALKEEKHDARTEPTVSSPLMS
ncbi:glucose-dependent insulinotropic receptor-like protein [Labeo rohita]|uniref:Glucose-dependent insulinotropic receptor-like protein n=1 Tax=Labeo rohita TaxID=84645 RepID=A0A498M3E1_LABRO|nr:glucose-dependent insulinotropic receptor-like protein [Labeo rohita]